MHKLLLEIFSEEIPATMQLSQAEKLKDIMSSELNTDFNFLVSPRHICLFTDKLKINNRVSIKGPKTTAPENALKGFLDKNNISKADLVEKDGILFYEKDLSNDESLVSLSKSITVALEKMVWPKSMQWSDYSQRWIRPLHAITCLLDDAVLPIKFGHITASNTTYGHRNNESPQITISSSDINHYIETLKKSRVVVSQDDRKFSILQQIEDVKPNGLHLIEDNSLLDEVVGLVENPHVMIGRIDPQFMSLPREVLVISLKYHQKYLLLEDSGGNLAPYFIIVSDIKPLDGGKLIISGNEKVLRARLSDAEHFMKADLKIPFENHSEKLKKVQFHEKVGSVYEKVMRVTGFAKAICQQIGINKVDVEMSALLCKNDLVTQMVGEFPELQGVVGYYYALAQGHTKEVALAIRDHYKPVGPNDSLPETLAGFIVAMSDKLDTLQSLFSVGIKPTSTKDPYALRRAALGIIRMLNANKELLQGINLKALNMDVDVIEFILERAKHLGENYDEINKCLRK